MSIEPTLEIYADPNSTNTDYHQVELCISNMKHQLDKFAKTGEMNPSTIYNNAIKIAQLIKGSNKLTHEPPKRRASTRKPNKEAECEQAPLLSPANLDATIEASRVKPLFDLTPIG